MPRTFGRNHNNINVLRRLDTTEVNVKAVCECKSLTLSQVRFDRLFIECRLFFIVDEDHNDIGNLGSLGTCHNTETLCFCLCPAL